MLASEFSFEKLTVYQRSLTLYYTLYRISQHWPREHVYGITDQLRRALLSVPLNIAEGYSRSRKDFQHFLTISRGSCFESIPLIKIAENSELLTRKEADMLYQELMEVSKMLSALRTSLTKRNPDSIANL